MCLLLIITLRFFIEYYEEKLWHTQMMTPSISPTSPTKSIGNASADYPICIPVRAYTVSPDAQTGMIAKSISDGTVGWKKASEYVPTERGEHMELIDKEVMLSALDKLISAREKCRNCSLRNTVEYNTIVYVKNILEKIPVIQQEKPVSAKKKKAASE